MKEGFRRYTIQLLDSGQLTTAYKHQLSPIKQLYPMDDEIPMPPDSEDDDVLRIEELDEELDECFVFDDVSEPTTDKDCTSDKDPNCSLEKVDGNSNSDDDFEPVVEKRFVKPDSLLDVQRLADERQSTMTAYQTRWAVKIFKG